ncbi:hypothetical protein [Paenibacillus guangzhouensis]|uniref:hypothetical protein n=1 Tax=Paenibacillus guangzhouensis TaxID=1473112 RepID=UPI00126763D5|nr:hypothetical protein [Paenibacillus guangzhouensis]
MKPMGYSPSNVSPSNVSPSNVSPANIGPSNVGPSNMGPSNVSPYAMQPMQMPSTLPAIVAPTQTVVKNSYHPATQPIVHPVNVINQHHTIPIPQHFCHVTESDVNCGMRARTKGVRKNRTASRTASSRTRTRKSR